MQGHEALPTPQYNMAQGRVNMLVSFSFRFPLALGLFTAHNTFVEMISPACRTQIFTNVLTFFESSLPANTVLARGFPHHTFCSCVVLARHIGDYTGLQNIIKTP